MAYAMADDPNAHKPAQQFAQFQGFQKPSNTNYHAQVASNQAIYNMQIEQNRSGYNSNSALAPGVKVSSLPADGAPPSGYLEQRSLSVDQGDQRKDSVNPKAMAQQHAFEQLTGRPEDIPAPLKFRQEDDTLQRKGSDARKNSVHEDEIRKYADVALKNHIAAQTLAAGTPIDLTNARSPGLPSSPRPDPHRRAPSNPDRYQSPALARNASVAQTQGYGTAYGSQHDYERKGSSSSSRNGSVDHAPLYGTAYGTDRKTSSASHSRNGSVDHSNSRKGSSATSSRNGSVDHTGRKPSVFHVRKESIKALYETPRSASNAGLKTIKVVCDQVTLKLSYGPTTTVADFLHMAREELGEGFDERRYVLVESFKEVGAERPLRHYERIRDVLSSWDSEEQDALIIQPRHTQWEYESLDLEYAPKIVPSDLTTSLYYSHRPESWHKWTFVLRIDGQVLMQKYKGGDFKAICHMSDYDIYVPTARQMRKMAPPKKYCFAIKSQQKAALFEDASNYIHFFCTNERELASEWYRAVHGWRSHYMVNSLGLGQNSPPLPAIPAAYQNVAQQSPLITQASYRKPSDGYGSVSGPDPYATQQQYNPQGVSGSPYHGTNYSRSGSVDRNASQPRKPSQESHVVQQPFAENGLLGREYDSRKESAAAAAPSFDGYTMRKDSRQEGEPFAEDGLLGRLYTMRKESTAELEQGLGQHPAFQQPRNDSVSYDPHSIPPQQPAPEPAVTPTWKFDPFTGQPLTPNAQTTHAPLEYPSAAPQQQPHPYNHSRSDSSSASRNHSIASQSHSGYQPHRKGSSDSYRNGSVSSTHGHRTGMRKESIMSRAERKKAYNKPMEKHRKASQITMRMGEMAIGF